MPWIKANYDRVLLAAAALALLACAGLLLYNAHSFNEVFAGLLGQVAHKQEIPKIDFERLAAEEKKIKEPAVWEDVKTDADRRLPLFVSVPYIENVTVDASGAQTQTLIDPMVDPRPLHPPIPNAWFIKYKLMDDMLAVDALDRDPDGDGFSNLEEFVAGTDPTSKESHPAYTTKLYLKKFIQKPFRFRFNARNGNTILLDTLDLDLPTQFLKVGDVVKGTKFKVIDLKIQEGVDPEVGFRRDMSVVTLLNTETGDKVLLQKDKDVDSPDSFALLTYQWTQPATDFRLKKNEEFALKPEDTVRYRLLAVDQNAATIERVSDKKTFQVKAPPK